MKIGIERRKVGEGEKGGGGSKVSERVSVRKSIILILRCGGFCEWE
jgi:hypothetical protein